MRTIDPASTSSDELYKILISTINPRPIAFVSSLATDGTVNLAPYSFFNGFGSNPMTLIFSTVKRIGDRTMKDTYHNVQHHREVVINMVSYDIVHQMSMTSGNYPADVSEFDKAGFTPLPSEVVKPPRVKESPVQYECIVKRIDPLGEGGGSGNLVICEAVRIHLAEHIFDERGKVDPQRLDLMGRLGRGYYVRVKGEQIFPIVRPSTQLGIGFDQLPDYIRYSPVLTGNELAHLAAVTEMPTLIPQPTTDPELMNALAGNQQDRDRRIHLHAQTLIQAGRVHQAWQVLLAGMEG